MASARAIVRSSNSSSDFSIIRDFEPWVYQQNAAFEEMLATEVTAEDVVVTHHLPSVESVPPRFMGSNMNAFFVCDMTAYIHRGRPKLWIHGHTHDSFDYRVNGTRVICNPRGYAKDGVNENPRFDPGLTVDVH